MKKIINKPFQVTIKRKTLVLLAIMACALLVTCALRITPDIKGTDSPAYGMMFEHTASRSIGKYFLSMLHTGSFGFITLNVIISLFTSNQYIYLFIVTLSILCLFLYGFSKFFNSDEKSLLVLAGLLLFSSATTYFYSINAIRQAFASGFMIIAVYYHIREHTKKTIINLVLATLMHFGSLFLVPVFLISKKLSRIHPTLFLLIPAFALSMLFSPSILLKSLSAFKLDFFYIKAANYIGSPFSHINVLVKYILVSITLSYFHIINRKNKDELYNKLLYMVSLSLVWITVFIQMSLLVNRYLLFISIFMPILFSRSIHFFKQKKLAYILAISLGFIYFLLILQHPSIQNELNLA